MQALKAFHATDPAADLKKQVGDLSGTEIFNNQVLVAVYLRPEKTVGGIILPDQTRDEDRYQGKVGLILKMGPQAFKDDGEKWFSGVDVKVGDWIFFRGSDSWQVTINKSACRIVDDIHVRGKVSHPDAIY